MFRARPRARVLVPAALTLVLAGAFALSPYVRALVTTLLLLPSLFNVGGPDPLVLVSGTPRVETFRVGRADADLYLPAGGGRHGALVMTLGVHPVDKREPVVTRLATGLARAGLVVLLVQSDDLVADRIEPAEPDNLVAAFDRLAEEPGVAPDRVGLFGFSAGASLAFLAATDPRIAERVRLVGWLGGYADAAELAREVAGHSFLDDGVRVPWEPHQLSVYVFRKQMVDALPGGPDRALLEAAFVKDFGAGDPAARARLDELGPEARQLAALFEAATPDQADALAAALPASVRARLDALSPLRAVDRFHSRAYVLVDRADPLVPYVQSRALARALPPQHLARYVEFEIFEHVQPTKPVAPFVFVKEAWKLTTTVAAILADLSPYGAGTESLPGSGVSPEDSTSSCAPIPHSPPKVKGWTPRPSSSPSWRSPTTRSISPARPCSWPPRSTPA